ncbi:hypothetical protein [Halalkalibaculum sp. DA384]|uniref:hypothetical protein n=1 Tax=Halalkalibaculum sp. DA384 TaxID=3373606 RepID=UPI0037546512
MECQKALQTVILPISASLRIPNPLLWILSGGFEFDHGVLGQNSWFFKNSFHSLGLVKN